MNQYRRSCFRVFLMFVFLLWEFHIIYFDHFLSPPPTPPKSPYLPAQPTWCPFSLLMQKSQMKQSSSRHNKQTWTPICVNQPFLSPGLAFECSDMPSAAPLKRTDFHSSSSCQFQTASRLRVGLTSIVLGFCPAWTSQVSRVLSQSPWVPMCFSSVGSGTWFSKIILTIYWSEAGPSLSY